jgi:hypothetical protein
MGLRYVTATISTGIYYNHDCHRTWTVRVIHTSVSASSLLVPDTWVQNFRALMGMDRQCHCRWHLPYGTEPTHIIQIIMLRQHAAQH